MGGVEVDRNDIDNEDDRIPSTPMDVFLWFYRDKVQSDSLGERINKVKRYSFEKDEQPEHSADSCVWKENTNK